MDEPVQARLLEPRYRVSSFIRGMKELPSDFRCDPETLAIAESAV